VIDINQKVGKLTSIIIVLSTMPKTVRIAKTDIDDVIGMFADLPAKEASDYSLREAIKQIVPAITELLKKGYNHSEVSQLLAQKNILISETTLRQYLRDFAPTKTQRVEQITSAVTTRKKTSAKISKTLAVEQINMPPFVDVSPSSTVDVAPIQVTSTATIEPKQPYKSPAKPGSENFK
jgi:hypothetical protein